MAGHSKWSNIKHRKAGQDARRGKIFTKIIRELTIAARDGGGSVEDNAALRTVVDKAKAVQMPKDTMERAIQRGAGGLEGGELSSLAYEGYGPGGVAILVETVTDNKNRTVAEVRHAFDRSGGKLGTTGSVAYLFEKRGRMFFESCADEDALVEAAIDAGADDVESGDDGSIEVLTAVEDFLVVKDTIVASGYTPDDAEIGMIAKTHNQIDQATAEKIMRLIDILEDLDDIQNVYTNADFPFD